MPKAAKIVIIVFSATIIIVLAGLYFFYRFLDALGPPEVTMTKEYISSDHGFINGLTIEKLQVDSMGSEDHPVKYTVTYMTTCRIDQPRDRPPISIDKIKFNKEGNYLWREEQV